MKLQKSRAKCAARNQAMLWLVISAIPAFVMLLICLLHPVTPFHHLSDFFHIMAIGLLGSAAAGTSLMASGWFCAAFQIAQIEPDYFEEVYSGTPPEEIALRQYNIWRFKFFGMQRYFAKEQESLPIRKLEEGCQPKDLFPHE